jgi:hypothetical protein
VNRRHKVKSRLSENIRTYIRIQQLVQPCLCTHHISSLIRLQQKQTTSTPSYKRRDRILRCIHPLTPETRYSKNKINLYDLMLTEILQDIHPKDRLGHGHLQDQRRDVQSPDKQIGPIPSHYRKVTNTFDQFSTRVLESEEVRDEREVQIF